ncbi:MAG: hypothetical protein KGM47_03735 [Acidobacteriota bacterium]|nr:hypothetical protein [Acidobacteriota bacterium]
MTCWRYERWLVAVLAGLMIAGAATAAKAQAQAGQQALQNDLNMITIPEGTEFKLQLHTSINSKTSKKGDRVIATLIEPVSVEDITVLRKGIRILGHINEVKGAGHRGKGGYLSIEFDTIEMPNGEKVAILGSLTEVFSSAEDGSLNVGPEGDLKGGGPSHLKQLGIFAVPTAGAAVAGGLGPGIAVGVAAGVAAMVLPKGKQAMLLAGSLIGMRLDEDVTVNLPPGTFNSPSPATAGSSAGSSGGAE